jgi:hypothetical protein
MPAAAAPIIRVAAPRAAPVKRRRSGGLRRRARAADGFVSQHNIDMAIGGAMVGLAVKQGWIDKLPAIPLLGRIGTAAIVLDYYGKHGGGQMAQRAATACAALAGYQLMQQGHISGDDESQGAPNLPQDGYADEGDDDDDEG